ncbi:MAG: 30S ribosomal protein S5 [Flavobacteriales bacterium]|uniref:30S ribosomal protein S5 n=1 Tax=Blattabacterium sp. (Mastotermes darwiniensis) TaxID=39768 RepID=UPI000231DE62|nr:30S ribosomal protein S5 [Blattabacterium sp. (Mastotermes darwiniensis)]AER40662.1 30S ribosomal protein S5 [Blattabacterium sp. (Mastotermes darwiniensis) str. MADAR]MDR1804810.1 30S ribosomal protein S5 [Flavobacteriales bacterium]
MELKEKLVGVTRVCKVTKGRRYFSFSAIVIRGNEKGMVGYGFGKSKEASDAIHKAGEQAKKNLCKVCIYRGTIPHEQEAKYGGARVLIKPASEGTGIIAGGALRAVLEAVGLKNVLSKSKGSSNPHNVIKATIKALRDMRDVRMISRLRGISIEKVYNG